jgi:hypothetical protein
MPSKLKSAAKHVDKIKKTMEEFKSGTLHSGSKKGPVVTNPRQALAIGLSEQKKETGDNKNGEGHG